MQLVSTKDLQNLEILKEVPPVQLHWLIEQSEFLELLEGDFLFKEGDPVLKMIIIISGSAELYILQNKNKITITTLHSGSITGLLPFSRATTATGNCQCLEPTKVLSFSKEKIKDLIIQHFELTQTLVHVMTSRIREYTALEQQTEKMVALGKLSAGIAHELNNPAAAIVRSSRSLKMHLQLSPDIFKDLISLQIKPEQVDLINDKLFTALANAPQAGLTMIQRTAFEDEISDWLNLNNIKDVSDMAENFVLFGFCIDDLEEVKSHVPEGHLQPILIWINNNLITEQMVTDIQEASRRIADLVGSVKRYTHMDGGSDKQLVDLHTGIRSTLMMLNYKIKRSGITVIEDYDALLPPIKAMVGELNQVWTNLIDNATDALESQKDPELIIKTRKVNKEVKISIIDNGPGIPDSIKSKIFDPFFTTKAIGSGTGLGLDVVLKIVKQHNGSVKLSSIPGKTEFEICFPIIDKA